MKKLRMALFLMVFILSACGSGAPTQVAENENSDYFFGLIIFSMLKSDAGDFTLYANPTYSRDGGIVLEKGKVYQERFEFLGCSALEGRDTNYPFYPWWGQFYSPGPDYRDQMANPVGVIFRETSEMHSIGTGLISFETPIRFQHMIEETDTLIEQIYILPDSCDFSK